MILNCLSAAYKNLCNSIQEKLDCNPNLKIIEVSLKVLYDFNNLTCNYKASMKDQKAFYCHDTKTIYINESIFRSLNEDIREVIIVHELGHAYRKFLGMLQEQEIYNEAPIKLNEDIMVDALVCEWGFMDVIKKSREFQDYYGGEYASNLDYWNDMKIYKQKMVKWQMKTLAGIPK